MTRPAQTLTQDMMYTALIAYLKDNLGLNDGERVRRAYMDNVPLPKDYPFVFVSILRSVDNATNEHGYDKASNTKIISTSMILDVQFDFYGPDSKDDADLIKQLFRDEYSVDYFAASGLVPLYADDTIQTGSTDEKENFKIRNTMTVHFNVHPQVTIAQDFFNAVELTVKTVPQDLNTGD